MGFSGRYLRVNKEESRVKKNFYLFSFLFFLFNKGSTKHLDQSLILAALRLSAQLVVFLEEQVLPL
jgi:hypothetical protein